MSLTILARDRGRVSLNIIIIKWDTFTSQQMLKPMEYILFKYKSPIPELKWFNVTEVIKILETKLNWIWCTFALVFIFFYFQLFYIASGQFNQKLQSIAIT